MSSGDDGEQKGIPGFWLKIFKNMDILSPMIRVCTLYLLLIAVLNVPVSDDVFTGGREVSDFCVLKYYLLNINYSVNILSECLRILIDCSQLSKTYYNVLFGSSARESHS